MSEERAAKAIRIAIGEHFRAYGSKADIAKSVKEGDPHGWTSGAIATIYTEECLPSACYEAMGTWQKVFDDLASKGYHCEPINSAVIGVYEG